MADLPDTTQQCTLTTHTTLAAVASLPQHAMQTRNRITTELATSTSRTHTRLDLVHAAHTQTWNLFTADTPAMPPGLDALAAAAVAASQDMLLTPAATVTATPTNPVAHLPTTVQLPPGTTDLLSTVTTPDIADVTSRRLLHATH